MARDPNNWRRQRDTTEHLSQKGGESKRRIALGLELLAMRAKRGVELTRHDIAAWAGCTDSYIYLLERRALKKLADRIAFGRKAEEFREHIAA